MSWQQFCKELQSRLLVSWHTFLDELDNLSDGATILTPPSVLGVGRPDYPK